MIRSNISIHKKLKGLPLRKSFSLSINPIFFKGTPSLARRSLLKNSPLDCFLIHPLRSALRQSLWNPIHWYKDFFYRLKGLPLRKSFFEREGYIKVSDLYFASVGSFVTSLSRYCWIASASFVVIPSPTLQQSALTAPFSVI